MKRQHAAPRPIRVVIIDDHQPFIRGLTELLKEAAPNDIVVVDYFTQNSDDIGNRVLKRRADVVLVDIVLGSGASPEEVIRQSAHSGLEAIRNMHAYARRSGLAIKILAYSNWPRFERRAYAAGAKAFIAPTDYFPKAIRDVYHGRRIHSRRKIGEIIGLSLDPKSEVVIVEGILEKTPKIRLDRAEAAFVYLLALERQRGESGWLKRTGSLYTTERVEVVKEICRRLKLANLQQAREAPGQWDMSEGNHFSRWCTRINGKVRPWLDTEDVLIEGPRKGRPSSRASSEPCDSFAYSLTGKIVSGKVSIDDSPLPEVAVEPRVRGGPTATRGN